jgi:hypothetical protein
VGLTISGQLFKRHFRASIGAKKDVLGLEYLRRHIDGPFILIWDRARPHIATCVEAYLCGHPEIYVEPLPAHVPELNPEEYRHGNIKQHLKNLLPDDVAQIRRHLDNGFARLWRRPDLILSCIHHASLAPKHLW